MVTNKEILLNHARILGLIALAVATGLVLVGTAWATTATSPKWATYTGEIKAYGVASISGSFATINCSEASLQNKIESHGISTTASGKVTNLGFFSCNYQVTVHKGGTLEYHTDSSEADGNATVTSTGYETTLDTSTASCTYTTKNTDIGTLTGGAPATISGAAVIPLSKGGFLCSKSARQEYALTVTSPSTFYVH